MFNTMLDVMAVDTTPAPERRRPGPRVVDPSPDLIEILRDRIRTCDESQVDIDVLSEIERLEAEETEVAGTPEKSAFEMRVVMKIAGSIGALALFCIIFGH
jgi:hypothetical protein